MESYNGFSAEFRNSQQKILDRNWANGTWPRPAECDVCRQTKGALHGHLEDYSKPETYIPLCITCHLLLHCRFHMNRKTWDTYKQRVGCGWCAPALPQRSAFYTLKTGIMAGNWPIPDREMDWPRTRVKTFLDTLEMVKRSYPPKDLWVPRVRRDPQPPMAAGCQPGIQAPSPQDQPVPEDALFDWKPTYPQGLLS